MNDLKDSEAIKAALVSHIKSNPKHLGTNTHFNWSDELLELRHLFIIALIREGYSRVRCNQVVSDTLEVSKVSADKYYREALEYLVVENDGIKGAARKVAIERLNSVVEDSKRDNNTRNVLLALDQLNRINGLYTEKKEVEITGIKFDFGGEGE